MVLSKRNRAGWFNLPCVALALFLQRAPAGPLITSVVGALAGPTIVVLRSVATAAAALGAVDSLAGATEFVLSQDNPVRGRVGEPLAVAFSIIAAPTAPTQFTLNDALPPGLTTFPELQDNRIHSATPVILGSPAAAGTFVVRVTGISGPFRRSDVVVFEISDAAADSGTVGGDSIAPLDPFGTGGVDCDQLEPPGDDCEFVVTMVMAICAPTITPMP